MRLNEVKLVSIRCKNSVTSVKWGTTYRCNALLAKVEEGKGEIVCYKCKHRNFYNVENALRYNNGIGGQQRRQRATAEPTK